MAVVDPSPKKGPNVSTVTNITKLIVGCGNKTNKNIIDEETN